MKLKLHTSFSFDSAHKLDGYRGLCKKIHGHSWFCDIWFEGDSSNKDNVGILVDFTIVKRVKEQLDHKMLNDVLKINPTAENISEWIYNHLKLEVGKNIKVCVRLYEDYINKKSYCECGDD